jgi:putative two-component system response regulator
MQKTIFVVDDNDTNLSVAKEALKEQYRVMTLPSAIKMFALIEKIVPDLILLDMEMPEMDGFEALQRLKSNAMQAAIPVIFLTSMNEESIEVRGFQLGVVDFIGKPFSAPVLVNRIKTHLDIDEIIRERTAKLRRLQNGIVYGLADIVESRDENTGGHIDRTTYYMEVLLKAMMVKGLYIEEICDWNVEAVISSARLHDVGKISIKDNILNKPGSLTQEEFETMKTHSSEGEHLIDQMVFRTGDEEFLHNARLFAGYHHERWDGRGYPYGLEGTKIPLQGRLMAFVDVYDALISERPYKKAFTHEEAVGIIMENAGKQFDPNIADVFYEVKDQFKAVKIH